jgi:hypothetical protein
MRGVTVALFLVLVAAAPATAQPAACCPCLSSLTNPVALFCEFVPEGTGTMKFAEDCLAKGGVPAKCLSVVDHPNCNVELATQDFVCPATAGAPMLRSAGLVGLVAILALGASIQLSRRRRRR